eukprot:428844-Pyramimonas_sp.AAC.1
MGPAALKKVDTQATQRRLLCEVLNSTGVEGLTGLPLLEPAKHLIRKLRAQKDCKGAGMIRTWLAGGLYCIERLHQLARIRSASSGAIGMRSSGSAGRGKNGPCCSGANRSMGYGIHTR